MKRIIVGVAAMLVAFALGVGTDRVIWSRSEVSTPTVEAVPTRVIQPVEELVPVVTPMPTSSASPPNRVILNYGIDFYPNGGYSFVGGTPKEFAEIDHFVLEYSEIIGDEPVGLIHVITKHGDNYESNVATFGSISERRLIFYTPANGITGFEYFFDGEFIRTDFDAMNGLEKAVLRGTLIKMESGKKIAERIVKLRIERHAC